jgi:hypothetical protein
LALQADEEKRLREIDAVLQTVLEQATGRRRMATMEEGAEKRQLAETVGGEISGLSHALSALADKERQEQARLDSEIGGRIKVLASQLQQIPLHRDDGLAAALREYQDKVVNGHLRKIRLADANIPLITAQNKYRLAEAGFLAAGDIGTRECKVQGIGPKKWAALNNWRRQLEAAIRLQDTPKALPAQMSAAIEQRYETLIKRLQQKLNQENTNLRVAKQDTTTRMVEQRRTLEQRKAAAESTLRQQTAAIEKKFNDQRRQVATEEEAARLQHRKAVEACRNEFRAASARLVEQGSQIKTDYKVSLDQFNKEIEVAARRVREIAWRRDQAERRYLVYSSLSFRHYSQRVLLRRS